MPYDGDALSRVLADLQAEPGWPRLRLPAGLVLADILATFGWPDCLIQATLGFDHVEYTRLRAWRALETPPSGPDTDPPHGPTLSTFDPDEEQGR